ncbi:alpha/beta hydrolase [Candidatus Foliamicus sp.]
MTEASSQQARRAETAPSRERIVLFSHGQESGPWGTKITALAEDARDAGLVVDSIDYRGMADPVERANKLIARMRECSGEILLVGSSMGGYVAVAAAQQAPAAGLFLMAPALAVPDWPPLAETVSAPTVLVHGWADDIVPLEWSVDFARANKAQLHLLQAGHGLTEALDRIRALFRLFLSEFD